MSVAPAVGVPASYDSVADFEPVSLLATFPLVVLVNAESPHKTLATSSPTFTLATELFKLKTGASLQRVPYRSSNEMVTAVVGKQVTAAMTDPLPAVPQVRDGKLRALAVTSTARLTELPDVPTMAEAGVSGAEAIFWSGLFAPKGTPREILNRLEQEVRAAMQDTLVRERLRALATDAASSTPAEFAARIKADIEMWSGVAKAANVTLD
jgi:tripartite-type tricarboxylate transporter receptor subunit TctC